LERQGTTNLEEGWTAFIGKTITVKEGEPEGENRRRRTEEVDPNMDTRVWHRMSNRPKTLFVKKIPQLATNAYMRRMIQGSSRMFNPLTFVLLPDALTAIRRRDKRIKSTWPLFQEVVGPAAVPNMLDTERLEFQKVLMDNSNRLAGAIVAFAAGDAEAGLAHPFDAYLVSTH
jgi:hypothetical protein